MVLRTKPILHVLLKRAEVLCLDWSPHEPNLLLAGASDGEVFPSVMCALVLYCCMAFPFVTVVFRLG